MSRTIGVALVAMGCLLAISGAVAAQSFPLGILPSSPESGDPLDAYVWTMESRFEIGDPVEIHLAVSRPAFVYLFDLQPDGIVRMLFPNTYSPNNYVTSSTVLPDGAYQLIAQPPAGIEELLIFAVTDPLPIPLGSPSDPFPVFASGPDDAIDELVSLLASIDASTTWAVGWTALQITGSEVVDESGDATVTLPAPPAPPPFAGSSGSAWYAVNGGWMPGIPAVGWYWYYGLEGTWHLCWVWQ
jgi:hypothetical protein